MQNNQTLETKIAEEDTEEMIEAKEMEFTYLKKTNHSSNPWKKKKS